MTEFSCLATEPFSKKAVDSPTKLILQGVKLSTVMLSVVTSSGGIITFRQAQERKKKKDVINLPVNPLVHTSLKQDHLSTYHRRCPCRADSCEDTTSATPFLPCWISHHRNCLKWIVVALVGMFSPVVLAFMKASIKSSMSGLNTVFPSVQTHSVL